MIDLSRVKHIYLMPGPTDANIFINSGAINISKKETTITTNKIDEVIFLTGKILLFLMLLYTYGHIDLLIASVAIIIKFETVHAKLYKPVSDNPTIWVIITLST